MTLAGGRIDTAPPPPASCWRATMASTRRDIQAMDIREMVVAGFGYEDIVVELRRRGRWRSIDDRSIRTMVLRQARRPNSEG